MADDALRGLLGVAEDRILRSMDAVAATAANLGEFVCAAGPLMAGLVLMATQTHRVALRGRLTIVENYRGQWAYAVLHCQMGSTWPMTGLAAAALLREWRAWITDYSVGTLQDIIRGQGATAGVAQQASSGVVG